MAVLHQIAGAPGALRHFARHLAGVRHAAALPERIRAAIADQQDQAERLIGLVQLAVVAVFGVLYFLSPAAYPPDVGFRPVPWVLAAYTLFTLLRVWLSFRVRLPDWFLLLSIFTDIGLLMTLIWSFHLQYEQPPSFYLKIPTLLYVFMFISLRTLRFEARFVAAAGLTAAVGWGLLVWYAAAHAEPDAAVTRDFVEYMTRNAILIGAEFDKIISILVVTAVLVVAQVRARRLLVSAVSEGQAAADLSRFFDRSLAARITGAERRIAAGEGQALIGAVLFLDIRGFSQLADRCDPTTLIRLLAECQARVVPEIQGRNGAIDKFLGDGVMATFGAATEDDTCAADALDAATAALRAVDLWNAERATAGREPIVVNAAVAAGRIVLGAVGDESRLEYTVVGAPVNLAAKLEKHAKVERERVLATDEVYAAALRQGFTGTARPLGPRRVHGLADPIDLVALEVQA